MSAPGVDPQIEPAAVARFIFEKGHLFDGGGARWTAFEPSRRDNTTSVFVTDGLNSADIWTLADTTRPQRSIARAMLVPADVRSSRLDLEIDNDPPRHAAIIGWPAEKSEIKALAQLLAAKASVARRI